MPKPSKELVRMRANHKRLIQLNQSTKRRKPDKVVNIINKYLEKKIGGDKYPTYPDKVKDCVKKLLECQVVINVQQKQIEDLRAIVFELEERLEELEK